MPSRFYHDEGSQHFWFRVLCQDTLQFFVDKGDGRWKHAQIDDARAHGKHKDQVAAIPIPSHEDAVWRLSRLQEYFILCWG
jgi:hypothetical protein